MNGDWKQLANHLLDEAERHRRPISMGELAVAVNKNRTTLWRNKGILQRLEDLEALVKSDQCGTGTKRRTVDQRVRALTLERDKIQRDYERMLQNFIIVCRRLQDRGIDPRSVLGELTPARDNDAWEKAILPWRDK